MNEQQLKEDASLYAVGLLEGADRARFERRLGELPELRAYVGELEDAVAAVALTSPDQEADPSNLKAIQARVSGGRIRAVPGLIARLPGGWPIAAALVALLAWGFTRYQEVQHNLSRAEGERDAVAGKLDQLFLVLDGNANGGAGSEGTVLAPADGKGGEGKGGIPELLRAAHKSVTLLQNLDEVKKQLAQFRRLEDERLVSNPGLARLTVVEMLDPTLTPEERERQRTLSNEVSDIIGETIETAGGGESSEPGDGDAEKAEPTPLQISAEFWPREVTVTGGMLPFGFAENLPNGTTIRQKGFTAESGEELGFVPMDGGRFYDPRGNLIWSPSANGEDYLGRRPVAGFDPDNLETYLPPADEPVKAPATEPLPKPAAEETAPAFDPKAFTLYDETTGQGSVIVQNLPEADQGSLYHLWLNDPRTEAPIPVGWIPNDLEAGSGRVFFELDAGFVPSGYLLTIEVYDESGKIQVSEPSDTVILHGP
jgi:hypothetical protein